MRSLTALKLFTRVARLGSFSAAAREAGLSQPQVSRLTAELEQSLGARLLTRTTRAVVLTDAGIDFLERVEQILAALDEATEHLRENGELRGMLRIGMPASIARRQIIPNLHDFLRQNPLLRINLMLDDRLQDLIRDAVDVSIRVGNLKDSGAHAKRIATVSRVVVASPNYLLREGRPDTPADLVKHSIISGPASSPVDSWQFHRGNETVHLDVSPSVSVNETESAVAAACAGLGVVSTTSWSCDTELSDGSLVRLFPEWNTADIDVHAYFPMGRATRGAARAFARHLTEMLARDRLN